MKAKIIFEFETKDDGIIVTAKTKGKVYDAHVMAVKKFVDERIKESKKNENRRKQT